MYFEVEIDKKDYKSWVTALQSYARSGNYNGQGNAGSRFRNMLLGALVGIIIFITYRVLGANLSVGSAAIGAILMMSFFIYFNHKYQQLLLEFRDGVIVGKQCYEVTETGVEMSTSLYKTSYTWQTFTSLEEVGDYLYLVMDVSAAHVIPKNQLNDIQINQLKELCKLNIHS